MARSLLVHTVKDAAGNVVQNALCNVYAMGTTTAVGDMFLADTGGSPVATLTSNAQGEIVAWFTTPKFVDIEVTDNGDTAHYPHSTATLLSWPPFTETRQVGAANDFLDGHTGDGTAAHAASAVSVEPEPGFNIADNVQTALVELNAILTAKADDDDVVHDTGDESIAGVKTFTGTADVATLLADSATFKNKPWVDVTHPDYGADGVGDDTVGVKAAFAALEAAGGGTLVFPPNMNFGLSTWTAQATTVPVAVVVGDDTTITGPGAGAADFLSPRAVVSLRGGTFDGFADLVDCSAATTELATVEIERVRAVNVSRLLNWSNSGDAAVGVTDLRVRHNIVTNCTDGVSVRCAVIRSAKVNDNRFETGVNRGVQLGDDTLAYEDLRTNLDVKGNVIRDLNGGAGSANGIIVYGRRATVIGNTIENVRNNAAVNAEGIYTKCRYSTVVGNVLTDAGRGEAAVNVKGDTRGSAGSPKGFVVVVADNIITTTIANVGAAAINVATDSVLVQGNWIEGAFDYGVRLSSSGSGSDIAVTGNTVYGAEINAVNLAGGGSRISVLTNRLYNTGLAPIRSVKNGGTDLTIADNLIHVSRAATGSGQAGVTIENSVVVTRVNVLRNLVYDCDRGLNFSGGAGAADVVLVEGNRLYSSRTSAITGQANPTNAVFRLNVGYDTHNLPGAVTIGGALDHDGSTVGFYGVTPATRPVATAEIKAALASLGLLTDGGVSPLNLDNGTLTAGSARFKGSPWFDVTHPDFGAVGNGTANDAAAFAAMITAAPAGSTCFIPPGDYLVLTPIAVAKKLIFLFAQGATVRTTVTNAAVFSVTATGVRFVGPGRITGPGKATAVAGSHGITFTGAGSWRVQDLEIDGLYHAIRPDATSTYGALLDAYVHDCAFAGIFPHTGDLIRGTRFSSIGTTAAHHAVYCDEAVAGGLRLEENHYESIAGAAVHVFSTTNELYGIDCVGETFKDCYEAYNFGEFNIHNVHVVGAVIRGSTNRGLVVAGNVHDSSFDVVVENSTGRNVDVSAGGVTATLPTHNHFDIVSRGGGTGVSAAVFVNADYCAGTVVVSGSATDGLRLSGGQWNTFYVVTRNNTADGLRISGAGTNHRVDVTAVGNTGIGVDLFPAGVDNNRIVGSSKSNTGGNLTNSGTANDTWGLRTDDTQQVSLPAKLLVTGELELDGALNHDGTTVGFYGVTPVARAAAYTQTYATADRTLGAYASDPESTAYVAPTLLTEAAKVDDLNALRVAYENLRVFVEDLAGVVNAHTDDLQAIGIVQ